MYRLYDYLASGNGYKVRLVLKYLGAQYEVIEKDVKKSETRTPEFLTMNPNGRIPLLEIPGKGYLAESHAIISYLAEDSELIPKDRFDRALMWQWLCFEQYNLEPNIGTVRYWVNSLKKTEAELGEKLVEKRKNGYAALDVLEKGLAGKHFLVGNKYSLADISLYAYTHIAGEGGFDLGKYPNIRAWCERIVRQSKWAPISSR
jgi:glutathione S-transferase